MAALKLIAAGSWAQVQVMISGTLQKLGMCTSATYDEDWRLQESVAIGYLGPMSIDTQGYTCTINLGLFVPEKTTALYVDGGSITVNDLLPNRDDVQAAGMALTFDSITFFNKALGTPIATFSGVTVASNGEQIQPNSYVTANMRFMAVKRVKIIPATG